MVMKLIVDVVIVVRDFVNGNALFFDGRTGDRSPSAPVFGSASCAMTGCFGHKRWLLRKNENWTGRASQLGAAAAPSLHV